MIIKVYNNSNHRTIGMKPIEVNTMNEKEFLETVFKYTPLGCVIDTKFKVGDRVRVSNKKDIFSNKYKNNYSREIVRIDRVSNTYPVTYNIKDLNENLIKGSFYEYKLMKTIL